MQLPALIPLPRSQEVLGLPRSTVYRLTAEGRLRMVKVASSSFITGDSAQAFIAGLVEAPIRVAKVAA